MIWVEGLCAENKKCYKKAHGRAGDIVPREGTKGDFKVFCLSVCVCFKMIWGRTCAQVCSLHSQRRAVFILHRFRLLELVELQVWVVSVGGFGTQRRNTADVFVMFTWQILKYSENSFQNMHVRVNVAWLVPLWFPLVPPVMRCFSHVCVGIRFICTGTYGVLISVSEQACESRH